MFTVESRNLCDCVDLNCQMSCLCVLYLTVVCDKGIYYYWRAVTNVVTCVCY